MSLERVNPHVHFIRCGSTNVLVACDSQNETRHEESLHLSEGGMGLRSAEDPGKLLPSTAVAFVLGGETEWGTRSLRGGATARGSPWHHSAGPRKNTV